MPEPGNLGSVLRPRRHGLRDPAARSFQKLRGNSVGLRLARQGLNHEGNIEFLEGCHSTWQNLSRQGSASRPHPQEEERVTASPSPAAPARRAPPRKNFPLLTKSFTGSYAEP